MLAVEAVGNVGIDDRFDRVGHPLGGNRRTDDGADRRLLVSRAAQSDLIDFLAILIDAE